MLATSVLFFKLFMIDNIPLSTICNIFYKKNEYIQIYLYILLRKIGRDRIENWMKKNCGNPLTIDAILWTIYHKFINYHRVDSMFSRDIMICFSDAIDMVLVKIRVICNIVSCNLIYISLETWNFIDPPLYLYITIPVYTQNFGIYYYTSYM